MMCMLYEIVRIHEDKFEYVLFPLFLPSKFSENHVSGLHFLKNRWQSISRLPDLIAYSNEVPLM